MFDAENDYGMAVKDFNPFPKPFWKFGTRQSDDRADA